MPKPNVPKIYLYKQIVDAKLFIDSNYLDKIDLHKIATQAAISKYHFHRIFKSCYGKTPHDYLTSLRINKAKELLAKGCTTKDVCGIVGFESVSSFVKLFKKKECQTPAEYAKSTTDRKQNAYEIPLNYIPAAFAEYLGWNIK